MSKEFKSKKNKRNNRQKFKQNSLAAQESSKNKISEFKKNYPFVFDQEGEKLAAGNFKENLFNKSASGSSRSWTERNAKCVYIAPLKNDQKLLETVVNCKKLVTVASMDWICRKGFQGMEKLNLIQSVVFETAYGSNENLLISAPTGAGKTNIAMLTVLHQIKQHTRPGGRIRTGDFKIIYVAPMKALAAEMADSFQRRLKSMGIVVKEYTGDIKLTKVETSCAQMLVTTPEKYDVITRKGASNKKLVSLVKLVIIDEVHLLHEERGAVIESIVARTLRQVKSSQKKIRIVGLSATLPNYMDVAEFLHVNPQKGLFYFDSRFRSVPLHQTLVGVKGNKHCSELAMDDNCYQQMLHYLQKKQQVMVFVHSRSGTSKTARMLLNKMREKEQLKLIDSLPEKIPQIMKEKAQKSQDKNICELLPSGFGCHNAGMTRPSRNLVEAAFKDGHIRVLVSTTTLAWGVNLPAHAVIIRGTEYFDEDTRKIQDISILNVLQIFGRAGRPQYDTEGHGVILCKVNKLDYYVQLLTQQQAIESKFLCSLNDNLNAEIALGTIKTVDDGVTWLSYTYLFVRMRKNPSEYKIEEDELQNDCNLQKARHNFIIESSRQLEKARLIQFDELTGDINSTDSGRLTSHYYIRFKTALKMDQQLKSTLELPNILPIIAESSEFEQIKMRKDEVEELEILEEKACRVQIDEEAKKMPKKVNTLIQAYISDANIESYTLISDVYYISNNVGRIARYLFDRSFHNGWANLTSILLDLCKGIELQMWSNEHPLSQFKVLSPVVLSRIEEKQLTVKKIKTMRYQQVESMFHSVTIGRNINTLTDYIPTLDVSVKVQSSSSPNIHLGVLLMPNFKWNEKYHNSMQLFWIILENHDNDKILYYHKQFIYKHHTLQKQAIRLTVAVPFHEPIPDSYYLRVTNDRWFGTDSCTCISLPKKLILAKKKIKTSM